jgi:O-antigen/teichoic acid export membrane protein
VLKRVATNTAWNVFGQLLPLLAALAAIPLLIGQIGLERFGFVSIAWILVGYASVFDFGVSKALIRTVAAHLQAGRLANAEASARTALTLLVLFGVMIGAALAALSPWLVGSVLELPPELEREALASMYILSASLPLVMLTTGYVGLVSAHEQFMKLNVLRAVLGVGSYALPAVIALQDPRLQSVVGAVVIVRLVGAVAFRVLCYRHAALSLSRPQFSKPAAAELLQLGGWMSVSNIVGPLMTYLDRLLLGALVPIREVAFYATPFDLVSKLMILPYSAMAALFPRSAGIQPGSPAAIAMLDKSMRAIAIVMFPPLLLAAALAHPLLTAWLGDEFADRAAPVLQLLALGMLFNSIAQAPATLIQSAGVPRHLAQLHLVELPLFLLSLWLLTTKFGIIGTALAAVLRSLIDAIAVYLLAIHGPARGVILGQRWLFMSAIAGFCAVSILAAESWLSCFVVGFSGVSLFLFTAWFVFVDHQERSSLRALLR